MPSPQERIAAIETDLEAGWPCKGENVLWLLRVAKAAVAFRESRPQVIDYDPILARLAAAVDGEP